VLRQIFTNLALFGVSVLVGASLYDAVVIAPNLQGGPAGIEHGRLFMTHANPGHLFRVAAPATQVLLLAGVLINWSQPALRWPLVSALVALVVNDVITFTYHYPRNRLFMTAPLTVDPQQLAIAARQWARANVLRVALVLGAWVAAWVAVVRLARAGR
jgi:uncharacterized membrane protein